MEYNIKKGAVSNKTRDFLTPQDEAVCQGISGTVESFEEDKKEINELREMMESDSEQEEEERFESWLDVVRRIAEYLAVDPTHSARASLGFFGIGLLLPDKTSAIILWVMSGLFAIHPSLLIFEKLRRNLDESYSELLLVDDPRAGYGSENAPLEDAENTGDAKLNHSSNFMV